MYIFITVMISYLHDIEMYLFCFLLHTEQRTLKEKCPLATVIKVMCIYCTHTHKMHVHARQLCSWIVLLKL